MLYTLGGIMIAISLVTLIFPPKKRNAIYGYRTRSSMKSQEAWAFANAFSSKMMIAISLVMIVLAAVLPLDQWGEIPRVLISMGIVIVLFVILFAVTEYQIKKRFQNSDSSE